MIHSFKFEHNMPKVAQALGIESITEDRCLEIIMFSTISNHLISEDLFDSRADAPSKLTTMSGDLETALHLAQTEQEKEYILFIFRHLHDAVQAAIAKNEVLNKMTGIDKKKAELVMQMLEIKLEENADEMSKHSTLTPKSVMNRIKLVTESKYNFEKYLLLLQNN